MTPLESDRGDADRFRILPPAQRGHEVLVDGLRVPFLEIWPEDGGKVLLVFDQRFALDLTAENYEDVTVFIGRVMKNVMNPACGRTFNRVTEITAVSDGSDQDHAQEGTDA